MEWMDCLVVAGVCTVYGMMIVGINLFVYRNENEKYYFENYDGRRL